jgi:gas vesicle protein
MSNNDDRNVVINVLAGIGLGAIIGAATALLLAPKSGVETREDLKKAADDLRSKAEGVYGDLGTQVDELVSKSKELIESTKTKVQEAIETGKKAMAEKKEEMVEEPSNS